MNKLKAIELLGGTTHAAAKTLGVTYQAISKWPDVLKPRTADRVVAFLARKQLPPELLGGVKARAAQPARKRVVSLNKSV